MEKKLKECDTIQSHDSDPHISTENKKAYAVLEENSKVNDSIPYPGADDKTVVKERLKEISHEINLNIDDNSFSPIVAFKFNAVQSHNEKRYGILGLDQQTTPQNDIHSPKFEENSKLL